LQEFWDELFSQLIKVCEWNLRKIEASQDGSVEAMCLLIEAAEHYQYIQQAYEKKCYGDIHVGLFFTD
jgi:hypothetical protein